MSTSLRLLALAPVVLASVTCVMLADAQEVSTSVVAPVSATTVSGTAASPIQEGVLTAAAEVSPLQVTAQPLEEWPAPGAEPKHELMSYQGIAHASQVLLADKYETWLAHLGTDAKTQTLPQNLLQISGCVEPCDMRKSLLIVNAEQKEVYVALVEDGRVTMRPSLMSWPDEAINPLKRWLSAGDEAKEAKK